MTSTARHPKTTDDASAIAVAGFGRFRQRPSIARYGTLLFFLLFFTIIGIKEGGAYISWSNFSQVAANNSHLAFLAGAVTLTLIVGQFDLSVGALAGMCGVLIAHFTAQTGMNLVLAVLLVLVCGAGAGLLNALLVTRLKVNAFIATLGTGSAFGGVALWVAHENVIFGGIPTSLTNAGSSKLLGIPLPMIYAAVLLVVLWGVTSHMIVGRFWYATGSNPQAAELAGVPVRRTTTLAFICTSALAAVAGIMLVSRFGSADPTTGPDLLLPAFAAAFLGSSILSDGRFTVVGAILATFLIAFATDGLQVAGASTAVQPIFQGAVLVAAVAITEMLRRRQRTTPSSRDHVEATEDAP
jgi:ribose transport system permease protein